MATFPFATHPFYRIIDIETALNLPPDALQVVDGILCAKGVDQAVFDSAIQGIDALGGLRDSISVMLKRACANAITAGIDHNGIQIPTGERDQQNLTGLCVAAVNGQAHGKPFAAKFWVKNPWNKPQKWTHQTFSGDELIEMGLAVIDYIQACQTHYAELLQQVEAATTAAQLLALQW